jgi:hypothetical protein
MTSIARIKGTSVQQYAQVQSCINSTVQKHSHIQFKLDNMATPSMLKLIGQKGLQYHLRQVDGLYVFTVSLK